MCHFSIHGAFAECAPLTFRRLTLEWQRGSSRRGWLQPASATMGHAGALPGPHGYIACFSACRDIAARTDWHDLHSGSIYLIKRSKRELTHLHSKMLLKQSTNLVARNGKSDQAFSWLSYKEGSPAHLHIRSLLSASPDTLQQTICLA